VSDTPLLELRRAPFAGQTRNARRADVDSCHPPSAKSGDKRRRFAHYVQRPLARVAPLGVAAIVTALLVAGWLQREEGYLEPGSGIGYWLGIAGASAMLLLLVYPCPSGFDFT
jgi:hypothetical protein